MKTLADRINSRMLELEMTQEQLAKRIRISQAAVQKITSGKTVQPRKLLEISQILKVTPEWLMYGDEIKPELKNIPNVVESPTASYEHKLISEKPTPREKIFLDLINALPSIEQDKLLRELEEKERYFKAVYEDMKRKTITK